MPLPCLAIQAAAASPELLILHESSAGARYLCVRIAGPIRPTGKPCRWRGGEDAGLALDKLDLSSLGRAKEVTMSKDETLDL